MLLEIWQPALERAEVFGAEILLVAAAVHLERADGRDDHRGLRLQPAGAALDVEEFLGAETGAETGLRHDDVGQGERRACCKNAIAAVRDVAERARVNKCGSALEGLDEIGADRVLEKQRHRARRAELAGSHGTTRGAGRRANDDSREPFLQVLRTVGQRDDRHHLARGNDDEMLLARNAVADAAEPDDAVAQCAIVHVDRAAR